MFSALTFAADYSFCVHQNKIFLKKNCPFTHELLQDSEDEEPFTCNFVGFCPTQSPEEFFYPKLNPTGKDLDNVIFKTIYEPESLVTGYCSQKCIYCGLSISDDESTSGKMEPSLNSDCGDNDESNLEKLDCQSYHLMEFSNSDLSDIESNNESCNSNSSFSMNLTSKVIANLSLPKEDLPYLLGCKVLLKHLSVVSIIPGDNVTHES